MDVNAHGEGRDVKIRSWKNNAFRSVRPPPRRRQFCCARQTRFEIHTRANTKRGRERERGGGMEGNEKREDNGETAREIKISSRVRLRVLSL